MSTDPAPKVYIPGEERLNVWTHAFGMLLALAGMVLLLCKSQTATAAVAGAIYGISMCILFAGSTLYHAAREPGRRAALRLVDHSAIYFLIAGTYTPLMLLGTPGLGGYIVLGVVWTIGIAGVTFELLRYKPFKGFSILLYIIAGWACMAIFPTLYKALQGMPFIYLLAGGIAYTGGVPFYVKRIDYFHAIWHVFVLAGAFFHYLAIYSLF